MRDITVCHPKLQKLVKKLIAKCKKKGIIIQTTECYRSVTEQDALYSKGRTTGEKGHTVTNAKGSTYSSMHQWYVAFDIILKMDIDKDGQTSDDIYNDNTGVFEKIGVIAKSIGLEWGGGWTSIKDRPHFQLKDWGSTPYKLKLKYGTPERFRASWK